MAQSTTVTCPACGLSWQAPIVLTNTTFVGFRSNVRVGCPGCATSFDSTPGDGTFSTINGRFQRVRTAAQLLTTVSSEDLRQLQQELEAVQAGLRSVEDAQRAASDGNIRRFWDLAPRSRTELYAFLALIVAILVALRPQPAPLSPGEVARIVDAVFHEHEDVERPGRSGSGGGSPPPGP